MKQVQEHISVPLTDLNALLEEAGECRVLNVKMYVTYKGTWMVDIILLLGETSTGCHECHTEGRIRKELGL